MPDLIKNPAPAKGQFLVYQAEDGKLKIDVHFEEESVWLTQQHMAELFQTTQQNISQHILRIYDEGELQVEATNKIFLLVRKEGNREVKRKLDYYNLDMIIDESQNSLEQVIEQRYLINIQETDDASA